MKHPCNSPSCLHNPPAAACLAGIRRLTRRACRDLSSPHQSGCLSSLIGVLLPAMTNNLTICEPSLTLAACPRLTYGMFMRRWQKTSQPPAATLRKRPSMRHMLWTPLTNSGISLRIRWRWVLLPLLPALQRHFTQAVLRHAPAFARTLASPLFWALPCAVVSHWTLTLHARLQQRHCPLFIPGCILHDSAYSQKMPRRCQSSTTASPNAAAGKHSSGDRSTVRSLPAGRGGR